MINIDDEASRKVSQSHCLNPVLARCRRMQRVPAMRTSIEQERKRIAVARGLHRGMRHETKNTYRRTYNDLRQIEELGHFHSKGSLMNGLVQEETESYANTSQAE